ncbi:Protein PHOX3 [Bienertia sinuspersici]
MRRAWPGFVVELTGFGCRFNVIRPSSVYPGRRFTSGLRHLPARWSPFPLLFRQDICRTFQEDLKGILFDGSNLESEDAELYDYISSLKNPKDILVHSSNLREEGNSSFKGGDLDGALEKYSLSMFLKKKEFGNVGHFCSIVLNHNPDNVQSLVPKSERSHSLGNYELASWDLKVAHDVEPSNQEVHEELREVEQILNSLPEKNHGQGKKEGEMSLGFSNHIKDLRIEERESNRNEEETSEETDNKSNSVKEVGSAKEGQRKRKWPE